MPKYADADKLALELHLRELGLVDEAGNVVAQRPKPLIEYQRDPLRFLVERLGFPRYSLIWSEAGPEYATHRWDGTPDPLKVVCDALAEGKSVAVESATGTGKTYLAGGLALWFLASFENARVPSYAPKEDQLRKFMWAEMGRQWPKFQALFPSAGMQDLELFLNVKAKDRDLWSASGIATQLRAGESISTKAAGIHAAHMMLVLEEVEGIPPAVIEALENTCTAPHNFFFAPGNPNSELGTLHQLYKRRNWVGVRISALDHPNVVCNNADLIPGAVSRKSILDRAEKYRVPQMDGRFLLRSDEAHRSFKSRTRGIPPGESERALIKLRWISDAQQRLRDRIAAAGGTVAQLEASLAAWPQSMGADPSQSEEGDMAGVARFVGPYLLELEAAPCPNAKYLAQRLYKRARALGIEARHFGVDAIGIGASTANELNDLYGQPIQALHSGGAPIPRAAKPGEGSHWIWDSNLFANLRAQMYWQFAMDLQGDTLGLPDDPELVEELVAVEYDDVRSKTLIDRKDIIRERLGRSPNKADAAVYANWVRARTAPPDLKVRPSPDQSLGFVKGDGGKLRPVQPQDVDRPRENASPRPGVRKYWG